MGSKASAAAVSDAELQETLPGVVDTYYADYWRENPGAILEVSIDDIVVDHEDDVRSVTVEAGATDKEFKSFVAAIQQNGYVPPRVRVHGGRLHAVDGRRRIAALKTLGYETVRVMPPDDPNMTRSQAIAQAMALNIQSKAMSPVERMGAIQKIQKASADDGSKLTVKGIADSLGVATGTISGYLSLAKYDAEALDLLHTGKVAYGAAIAIMAESGPEAASDQLKALAAQAEVSSNGKGKVTYGAAKKALRKKADADKDTGGGKTRQLNVQAAIAGMNDAITKLEKGTPEYKIAHAVVSYLRGTNSVKSTLGIITRACA